MYIHQVREIVNGLNVDLQEELKRKMEQNEGSVHAVIREDPFLAGQIHAMTMLTLKLTALELDQEHERELQRAKRG